jgi:hypothetical protein
MTSSNTLILCWFCGQRIPLEQDAAGLWCAKPCSCEAEREGRKAETKEWEGIAQAMQEAAVAEKS